MNPVSSRHTGLLNKMKKQPGKTAMLGLCMVMLLVIWGPMVFGSKEDEAKKPKPSPNAVVSASVGAPGSPNKKPATLASNKGVASKIGPTINTFKSAVDRLDSWRVPLGMEKAEPLTPAVIALRRAEALRASEARMALTGSAHDARVRAEAGEGFNGPDGFPELEEGASGSTPEVVAQIEITDLELTGTAMLGSLHLAFFGDQRIQEGEKIGRYLVKAVRSREVDIWADGRLTVLRMAPPDLEFNKQ